jgi:hypothetical protein
MIEVGMAVDVFAGAVFSVDVTDMSVMRILASAVPPVNQQQPNVKSVLFDINDNKLYAAFYVMGGTEGSTHTLDVCGTTENFVLKQGSTVYSSGHIFVEAALGSTPSRLNAVQAYCAVDMDYEYIPGFGAITGDRIILAGTFGKPLVFDAGVTPWTNNKPDVFVVGLDKTSLAGSWVKSFRVTNGEFTSAAFYNERINVAYNKKDEKASSIFACKPADGLSGYYLDESQKFTNAIAAGNGMLIKVTASTSDNSNDLSTVTVTSGVATTGINNPKAAASAGFYPNPVTDVIYLSEPGSIDVYNSLGVLVKQAVAVDRLNVESLPAGIYFATVKTAVAGKIKFIKK